MKKKIYAVVLCALMCVVMCVPALADTLSGLVYAGSAEAVLSFCSASGKNFDVNGMSSIYCSGYINSVSYEFAFFVDSDAVGYIDGDYYYFIDDSFNNVPVNFINFRNGLYVSDSFGWSSPGLTIRTDSSKNVYPSMTIVTDYVFGHKMFKDKQSAVDYFKTGSTDGLIFDGSAVEYDSSVPAPTEVHIESRYLADEGCPRTTIAFKSSETYESSGMQTEIRYRYSGTFYESGVFGDSKTNRKAFTSPIYKKDLIKTLSVNYVGNTSNNNTVIMNWYDEFMDNDAYKNYAEYKEVEANKHSISWIAAPFNSIEYWIRNVTSDNKASDWVHCKYNYDTGELEETWTDTVPGGRTDVIDGNVEPGEETPGDIKDSYEIDSNIKNDGGFDTNSSGLISSIKDLFSDNGVVGMVKDILGFMPGWMIAYVSLFFTILIALMILYFVRG